MALDKKRSVYEIAIEIGGKMKQSLSQSVGKTKKEMSGLESSISKMSSIASGVAKFVAGSVVVGMLKNVATSAIDASSEMETYRATLNTVLKDEKRAGEMMAWATDFAAHTPFSTGDIVDAVTRLEAYGFKSQAMMENIGNMASAMNKDLPTAVEAVYKATLGEMELMENNFAITKKLIKEKSQEWYGQAAVTAAGAIANAELYNNTLLRLVSEKFEGGMERQSKTWAGIKSNMEDSKEAILRKIIGMDNEANALEGGAYAKFLSFMGGVSEKMSEFADSEMVEEFTNSLGELAEEILPKIESALGRIGENADEVTGVIEATSNLFLGVGDFIEGANTLVEKLSGRSILNHFTGRVTAAGKLFSGFGDLFSGNYDEMWLNWDAALAARYGIEPKHLDAFLAYKSGRITKDYYNSIIDPKPTGAGRDPSIPRNPSVTTGDIVVHVTTQPGDDANAIGRTVGERVREAIAEAQHQNRRMQFTQQLAR